jgi:hypothetical protein
MELQKQVGNMINRFGCEVTPQYVEGKKVRYAALHVTETNIDLGISKWNNYHLYW